VAQRRLALTLRSKTTVSDTVETVERSRDRRAEAYDARRELWSLSKLARVRSCGRSAVTGDGSVAVRVTETGGRRVAGFAGLATCGSVWACPVCARKIAAERQADLEQACTEWERLGGSLALLTLTVQHHKGQSLQAVWNAVRDGWQAVTSGRSWQGNQASYGIEGWARVVEVVEGEQGWHVHVHAVLFLHHSLAIATLRAAAKALYGRWAAGIGKTGFRSRQTVRDARGQLHWVGVDLREYRGDQVVSTLAGYLTKQSDYSRAESVAMELTRGDLKPTRASGSRTPFRILADLIGNGDAADLALWEEYERVSKGRRQLTWSRGFRQLVGLLVERSDDEIVSDELSSAADDVVILPAATWREVRAHGWLILDMAEMHDARAFRHWLDRTGIDWLPPG
jgi:hypothetical protein